MKGKTYGKRGVSGIMKTTGAGDLVITRGSVKITVPQKMLTKNGLLKKSLALYFDELTKENVEALEKLNVIVSIGYQKAAV